MSGADRIERASILTKANVFFEGRCISHTVHTADGARKSVGVTLPGVLEFETAAPERMEIVAGRCRVQLAGSEATKDYAPARRSRYPRPAASGSKPSNSSTTSATSAERLEPAPQPLRIFYRVSLFLPTAAQ